MSIPDLRSPLCGLCVIFLCVAPGVQAAEQAPATATTTAEPEAVVLHVTLNTADAGAHLMALTHDGDLLLKAGLFKSIGLSNALDPNIGDEQLVSLRSLAPGVKYNFDPSSGELALQADPALLPVNTESVPGARASSATLIQDNGAFLNYHLNYSKSGSADLITAPTELGVNFNGFSFINNVNWQQHQTFTRTQSLLIYDDTDSLQRWMAGDVAASAGNRIGGSTLGGVRLAKSYGLRPGMFTGPPLSLKAMLLTPSEVEVTVNGQRVYKADVAAGELDLNNIPYYRSGLGNAELVIRDAFGREQYLNQSFYTSATLLAPGLHAYDYSLGAQQSRSSSGELSYGDQMLFFGTHRYGLTDWFTPGIGIESNGSDLRGGLMADLLLGQFGQLDLVTAISRRHGVSGNNVQLDYSYSSSRMLSPSFNYAKQSINYGGILDAQPLPTSATEQTLGAGLTIGLEKMGSVSARWNRFTAFDGSHRQNTTAVYSKMLPQQVSLVTQLSRNTDDLGSSSKQFSLSLGHSFSNGLYLSANFNHSDASNAIGVQLQMSPPLGIGSGYNAGMTAQQNGGTTTQLGAQYHGRNIETTVNRNASPNYESYNFGVSGAVLLADNKPYLSRPIRGSYALLRTGVEHVKVKVQNQEVGETDSDGVLPLPYLNAYSDNTISIDTSAVPLGYSVDASSRVVTTRYRSGGIIDFDIKKLHAVDGKAYFKKSGVLVNAQYAGLDLQIDGKKQTFIIGYAGEMYLENLSAGSYQARMYDAHTDCRFDLVIPESDQVISDLGDVVCDVSGASKRSYWYEQKK